MLNSVTIKIIYDNCKADQNLEEGWGFSCLIDTGPRKILFDSGANAQAFFSNLQKLNISCDDISDVVYSHKHADHISGMQELAAKLKQDCRLFLPKNFPSRLIPSGINTKIVEDFQEIDSDIYCLALKGGLFFYEEALIIRLEKGLVIITGCAHPGIVHILEEAQHRLQTPIYFVLGGFHLFRCKQSKIHEITKQFKNLQVQKVAPCHCSGPLAIQLFQEAFQDACLNVGTGSSFTIG